MNVKIMGIAFGLAALLAASVLLVQSSSAESATSSTDRPAIAPGWKLQTVDGKTLQSSDFKGKVVILDFWATWCPPCRAEIPDLIALQKQYGEKGLAVIGVSVDQDGAAAVKTFAKKFGINYPVVLADQKVVRDYGGIEGIPTTFVIDRLRRIVTQHVGYTDKADFENEITPLLSAK